jgi:hypothetical protein
MKMMNYFGFKVADRCWAKSQRAGFRFMKHDCLQYDMSYTVIMEIKSENIENIIKTVEQFANTTSKGWKEFCKDEHIRKGGKHGTLGLHLMGPERSFLENSTYIWKPYTEELNGHRVWFLVHPGTAELIKTAVDQTELHADVTFYRENLNVFHLIGPESCHRVYGLIEKLAGGDQNFLNELL